MKILDIVQIKMSLPLFKGIMNLHDELSLNYLKLNGLGPLCFMTRQLQIHKDLPLGQKGLTTWYVFNHITWQ